MRTSHYPPESVFYNQRDKEGLLLFTALLGWRYIGGAERKTKASENMQKMVLQYRNYPCIILWDVRINKSLDDDEIL